MQRPACGLCQRTGTACTVPTKRRAPSVRKPNDLNLTTDRVNKGLERLLLLLGANNESVEQPEHRQNRRSSSLLSDSTWDSSNRQLHVAQPKVPEQSTQQGTGHQSARRNSSGLEVTHIDVNTSPIARNGQIAYESPVSVSVLSPAPHISRQLSNSNRAERLHSSVSTAMSFDMAMHLIDLFFDKIQPWLPLLHKPSFRSRYADYLQRNESCLRLLPIDEALLLYGIFALAARHSPLPEFAAISPVERGDHFYAMARDCYNQARELSHTSMPYLQGCILLSFWHYTSDPSPQGWIVVGECVRLAYEIGLWDIDKEEEEASFMITEPNNSDDLSSIEKEEKRRAWWLVWELDTFGSTVCARPYAIDSRHMRVKLPISDDAWFSGASISSAEMITEPGQSWKSLQGSENQDVRAWFLVANYLMARALECARRRRGISEDELVVLENETSCFKLSLPAQYSLNQDSLAFDPESSARCNSIIGIHLMLVSTSFILSNISVNVREKYDSNSPNVDVAAAIRAKTREICRIVGLWPPDYISEAHPFLAFALLPVPFHRYRDSTEPAISSSSKALLSLVLARFNTWKISTYAFRGCSNYLCRERNLLTVSTGVAELIENPSELSSKDADLLRRFAALIPDWTKGVRSSSANDTTQLSDREEKHGRPSTPFSGITLMGGNLYEPHDVNFLADFSMHNPDNEGQQTTNLDHLNFMSMDFERPTVGHTGQTGRFLLSPRNNDELARLWSYLCRELTAV